MKIITVAFVILTSFVAIGNSKTVPNDSPYLREFQMADELQTGANEESEVVSKRERYSHLCRQGRDVFFGFGSLIAINAETNPIRFNGHGKYCGKTPSTVTGHSEDALDECCRIHDLCYGDAVNSGDCYSFSPYVRPYLVTYSNGQLRCPRPTSVLGKINLDCGRRLCQCDYCASLCFRLHKDLLGNGK